MQLESEAPPKPTPKIAPETDLTDAATQDKIMNPDAMRVKLSYGELELHQPSVATRRRIYGFVTRVFADAASLPGSNGNPGILGTRIASLLTSREDLEGELIFLCCKLLDKPGAISDERAESLGDEISAQASPDDIAVLYAQLSVLANVSTVPADPPTKRRRRG